jgi:hypothetical protein
MSDDRDGARGRGDGVRHHPLPTLVDGRDGRVGRDKGGGQSY